MRRHFQLKRGARYFLLYLLVLTILILADYQDESDESKFNSETSTIETSFFQVVVDPIGNQCHSLSHYASTVESRIALHVITLDQGNFTNVLKKSCNKDSSRLVLVVFYTSSCSQQDPLFTMLEEARPLLRSAIISQNERFISSGLGWESSLTVPIFAKVNVDGLSDPMSTYHSWLRQFDLNQKDEYPILRLLQIEDLGVEFDDNNYHVHSIAFIGPMDTAQDIVDGMMHYLSRLTLSAFYYDDEINKTQASPSQSVDTLPIHLFPSRLSLFAFSTIQSFHRFLQLAGSNLYHDTYQDLNIVSDSEKAYIEQLMTFEEDGLKDPYMAFIQCRCGVEHYDPPTDTNEGMYWYDEYEALAEIFIHRRDVAFFIFVAYQPQDCYWFMDESTHEETEWNGAIRVLKLDSSNTTTWGDVAPSWYLGATFIPDMSTTKDSDLSMKNFIVFHSTPSLLWFDRFTSAVWAFHWKRKIHTALFIDMHSPNFLNDTEIFKTFERTHIAVKALRKVSLEVRRNHPQEDIVFLIIPSTEIRIMRTFGIDVWSPMDEEVIMGNATVAQVLSRTLPQLVITSRNESSFYTKRYFMKSHELMKCNNNYSDCNSNHTDYSVHEFLKNFLEGRATHENKSQQEPTKRTNDSGVISLTGNGFQSLMSNLTRDTLIQFYSPWCGHCKRFQVIWNKLARLVRFINIDLDVMKIDVTANDIYHPKINLQDVPAVYYFSKLMKQPVQLKITGDEILSRPHLKNPKDILDWVIKNGDIDRDKLLQLLNV